MKMNKTTNYKLRGIIFCIIGTIIMIVIFYFSAQEGDESTELSNSIYASIVKYLSPILSDGITDFLYLYIRKVAHFSIYMLLSASLSLATYNFLRLNNKVNAKYYAIPYLICVLYAISDEYHQSFTPGRTCSLRDMAIDSLGAMLSLIVVITLYLVNNRKRRA